MAAPTCIIAAGVETDELALRQLIGEVGLELVPMSEGFGALRKRLEDAPPLCLLVDCNTPAGQEAALGIRMTAALSDTPVIAIVGTPWSDELAETFALGADDYVTRDAPAALRAKLATLLAPGAPTAMHRTGTVVLADSDRDRRIHLARHLRGMGLMVDFAVDGEALPSDTTIKLVVAQSGLPPDGAVNCLDRFRRGPGEKIPWVVVGPRAEAEAARVAFAERPAVAFFDGDSDATGIVFTANQVMTGAARSMRRSPRLIYETAVQFQVGDTAPREWGVSYNLNRGGLYIRTLTPPALGAELQVEFTPPHGRGHAIVDARVVWRQEYSGGKGYPPGIGVEYLGTQPLPDRAALDAGYTQLLEDCGNPDA
jgi:CheY-like chemotaxis protein